MAGTGPIADEELEAIFTPCLALPVALAVSGGADSTALMHLVARWMDRTGRPQHCAGDRDAVTVVTVDHGLRPESAAEALWVKRRAEELGFSHATLVWPGPKPATGLQEAARAARYELMRRFVTEETALGDWPTVRAIVTAHTEDDQAETVLMRLARGSGVDGLSAMQVRACVGGVNVLRPLLATPKARLVATLEASGLSWLADPSNDCARFERVRIRAAREQLASLGLTSEALAASARRLARARDALEAAATDLAKRADLDVHAGAFATLDRSVVLAAPLDLGVRLMAHLVGLFGGHPEPARLSRVEDLCARLAVQPDGQSTLAGSVVRWSADRDRISVWRESTRGDLPTLDLKAGESALWDRRFHVRLGAAGLGTVHPPATPVAVRALGAEVYARLRRRYAALSCPAAAAASLPSFWANGELLAVPHFGTVAPHLLGPLADGRALCEAEFQIHKGPARAATG